MKYDIRILLRRQVIALAIVAAFSVALMLKERRAPTIEELQAYAQYGVSAYGLLASVVLGVDWDAYKAAQKESK